MKDYSLSDVTYCNTKEGMHEKAKQKGLKAWSLGCSCNECNKDFEKVLKMTKECECRQPIFKETNDCMVCGLPLRMEYIEWSYQNP